MSFWKKSSTKETVPTKATPADYEKAFNTASEKVSLISPGVEVLIRRIAQDELRISNLNSVGAETRHLARILQEISQFHFNDTLLSLHDSVDDFREALDNEDDPADMLDVKNATRGIDLVVRNLLDQATDANSRLDALEDSLISLEYTVMSQATVTDKISPENEGITHEGTAHEADSTPEEEPESEMDERQRYWTNFFKSLTPPTAHFNLKSQSQSTEQSQSTQSAQPAPQPQSPLSLDVLLECCYQKWCTAGKDFDALTIEDRIVKPWIKETRRRNSGIVVDIYEAKTPDDLDDAVYGWLEGDEIIPAPEGEELDFIRYVYETELENVS